jgi:hypothetical protein
MHCLGVLHPKVYSRLKMASFHEMLINKNYWIQIDYEREIQQNNKSDSDAVYFLKLAIRFLYISGPIVVFFQKKRYDIYKHFVFQKQRDFFLVKFDTLKV